MQFLTKSECEALCESGGFGTGEVQGRTRVAEMKNAVLFFYTSRLNEARLVADQLVAYIGDFRWAMLWAYEFPWGDRSLEENPPQDWRHHARWRQTAGETRTLYDAPGHFFEPEERVKLADAIEFAIYTGWDAALLGKPAQCIITLSHDDFIAVQSRYNLTALEKELNRLGLRRGDFA
jgi:hypothetical protein